MQCIGWSSVLACQVGATVVQRCDRLGQVGVDAKLPIPCGYISTCALWCIKGDGQMQGGLGMRTGSGTSPLGMGAFDFAVVVHLGHL